MAFHLSSVSLIFIFAACYQADPAVEQNITPVPMDKIDTSNDEKLTFTEFLLSDKDYIEGRSREFHALDADKDGVVSRAEFEEYYEKSDGRHGGRMDHDSFFSPLGRPSFNHFFPPMQRHNHQDEEEFPEEATSSPSTQSSPKQVIRQSRIPFHSRHHFFFF